MPRQERARVTREAILRAAAEEFEQSGSTAGSLRNVLQRSGVTKGAFYFHFASKDALVDELIGAQQEYGAVVYRRWRQQADDPLTVLVGTLVELAQGVGASVQLRAGFRLAAERSLADADEPSPLGLWEETVAAWLGDVARAGLLRPEVDVAAAARALHSMFIGARMVSFTLTRCADYAQRVAQFWELLLPRIATEKWLAEWRDQRCPGLVRASGGPL